MGIIIRQGIQTSIISYAGVAIGAFNVLWLFPKFLGAGEIGLITAEGRDDVNAPVVVGTVPRILEGEWDAVILPDADAFLAANSSGAAPRYQGWRRAPCVVL